MWVMKWEKDCFQGWGGAEPSASVQFPNVSHSMNGHCRGLGIGRQAALLEERTEDCFSFSCSRSQFGDGSFCTEYPVRFRILIDGGRRARREPRY